MSVSASTAGWDLVYAVRIPDVNARIAGVGASPRSFSAALGTITVTGSFQPWQIVPGGDGYLVCLSIPISTGKVSIPGQPDTPIAGTITVQVELDYLPNNGDATQQALQIKQSTVSTSASAASATANATQLFCVTASNFTPPLNPMIGAMVNAALTQWLQSNLNVFNHIFSVIDLKSVVAESSSKWLAPTSIEYAYCDGATLNDCMLGILAMTQNRDSSGLSQCLSAGIIPDGEDAALLISPYVLLTDLIQPAMPAAYPGTQVSDFSLAPKQAMLQLNAPVTLTTPVQGTSTLASLDSLTIEFCGTELTITSEVSLYLGQGVTGHTKTLVQEGMKLAPNAQGQQSMQFYEIDTPQTTQWDTTDPDYQKSLDDIDDVLLVIGIVADIVTGGVAGTVLMLVFMAAGEIIDDLPTLVAGFTQEQAPAVDLLAINATTPLVWQGSDTFKLSSVDLVESLRLTGTPWS